ncbi:MAG TPA: zf-HC2 domain-containing protein [Candidatus Aquicultor sp.]
MCYNEGTLQAYLDRELPGRKRWEIEAHIATCAKCSAMLARLEEANEVAKVGLSAFAKDISSTSITTDAAWQRLTHDERFGTPAQKKGAYMMLQSRAKAILIPVAAAAIIAVSFSFAPVREAAAGFLNIFRVEKVQTITISQDDLQQMQHLGGANGGKVDIKNLGKFETTGFKEPVMSTAAEAKKAVDFDLKTADIAGYGAAAYKISPAFSANFTLNVEQANSIIKVFGGSKALPASLDNKTFSVKVPTVATAEYKNAAGKAVTVAEARSPELVLPEGTDPAVVRDALLGMPLPENFKAQLRGITDWTSTLVIPNINGTAKDVTVNGTSGVFITPPKDIPQDMREKGAKALEGASVGSMGGLIWQKDGVVYAVGGEVTLEQAQAIASSLK